MRHFDFELQLPDGSVLTETVAAFTWPDAFSRACRRAEDRIGIAPGSGIVCVAYRSSRLPQPALVALAA